jgi:hypothetical protein
MLGDKFKNCCLLGLLLVFSVVFIQPVQSVPKGVPESGALSFRVYADGSPVGWDRYQFEHNGDTLHVRRSVSIDISWFYLDLATYRHKSHGIWVGDTLTKLNSQTDFNGTKYQVLSERKNGRFVVSEQGERSESESPIIRTGRVIPTSWWTPEVIGAEHVLDSQYGEFRNLEYQSKGRTPLPNIESVDRGRKYKIMGDINLTIWFDPGDQLVKLTYEREGISFVHRLSSK